MTTATAPTTRMSTTTIIQHPQAIKSIAECRLIFWRKQSDEHYTFFVSASSNEFIIYISAACRVWLHIHTRTFACKRIHKETCRNSLCLCFSLWREAKRYGEGGKISSQRYTVCFLLGFVRSIASNETHTDTHAQARKHTHTKRISVLKPHEPLFSSYKFSVSVLFMCSLFACSQNITSKWWCSVFLAACERKENGSQHAARFKWQSRRSVDVFWVEQTVTHFQCIDEDNVSAACSKAPNVAFIAHIIIMHAQWFHRSLGGAQPTILVSVAYCYFVVSNAVKYAPLLDDLQTDAVFFSSRSHYVSPFSLRLYRTAGRKRLVKLFV